MGYSCGLQLNRAVWRKMGRGSAASSKEEMTLGGQCDEGKRRAGKFSLQKNQGDGGFCAIPG